MKNVAILGLGVVGSGTADLLTQNADVIKKMTGEEVCVKYVLDIRDLPDSPYADKIVHDFSVIVNDPEVDIVAEVIGGVNPALDYSMQALKAGKSVVTSNKELVAKHGEELISTARENGVQYLFEASVGGGIPVLRPLISDLAVNSYSEISGILNGTTNYILTQMFEHGKDYETALSEAQQKGYAERNPASDVEGIDTCRKICILAGIAFGIIAGEDDVYTQGIGKITQDDVRAAANANCSIKLLGRALVRDGKKYLMVCPHFVPNGHPLYPINDVYNGVVAKGNFVGDVMFYGRGAGAYPTASAVCSDIAFIAAGKTLPNFGWTSAQSGEIAKASQLSCRWYLAFEAPVDPVELGGFAVPSCNGTALISGEMTELELEEKLSALGASLTAKMRTLL
jgi:homoserine dehydrogenase